MTTVINIKDAPKGWWQNYDYVYIGRQGGGLTGKWGNPFKLTRESERQYIVDEYRDWLYALPQDLTEKAFLEDMKLRLTGKILVCFCKPKACHGDVIVDYLNGVPYNDANTSDIILERT